MIMSMDKIARTPRQSRDDSLPDAAPAGLAHGGALSMAARLFPHAPRPFLDLSTGINPVPYPVDRLADHALTRLPDTADEARLREVAAQAYGVRGPELVAASPGTQMLISLLPALLARPPGRVAILSPTYNEHAAAWAHARHEVHETSDLADLAEADIAVICNPNNPDGRCVDATALLRLADSLAARGGLLIADESFADLEPGGTSLAQALPHPAILILRSFGKSYGLAGVRLGFALAAPELATRLRSAFGPWAISGPALAAGLQALPDEAWRSHTIARLDHDVARLDALITGRGAALIGGTRLFRLYASPDAWEMHNRLGAAGILVRRFDAHPTWLRFGLPGTRPDWARLEAAMPPAHNALNVRIGQEPK
jgi:cobalamin biosynthetic protein CobC